MSTNFSQKRLQTAYLATQTDPLIAATLAAADAAMFTKCNLNGSVATIKRPDITGSRSTLPGKNGRHTATWDFACSLANLAAGGTPDITPILECGFGQAATVVASTSATWTLSDTLKAFTLGHFRSPATLSQRLAYGCAVQNMTFTLGSDVATFAGSGPAVYVVDSDMWGSLITEVKGGLSAAPVQPVGSPVYVGDMVIGFTGAISAGGNTIATLKNLQVKIGTGQALVTDTFNKFAADGIEADERSIQVSFTIDDSDDTATKALKVASYTKAGIDITAQAGLIVGNRWHLNLKGVQLASPTYDDGQRRFRLNFGDSEAHGTTITALDEVSLVID